MQHSLGTHTIFNQTPPLTDYNLFLRDTALQEAVQREGADWACTDLKQAGGELGTGALLDHARLANRITPVLHNFNAQGERIDASALPVERRVRHKLDLARAHDARGHRDRAEMLLLDADELAPEQVGSHYITGALLNSWVRSPRDAPNRRLSQLAERLGIV